MKAFICCFLVAVTIGILGNCGAQQGTKIVTETFSNGKKSVQTGNPTVTFSFFTQRSRVVPYVFNLDENMDITILPARNFNADKLTIFVTHGMIENERYLVCTRLRDAYLKKADVNVVVVTWNGGDFSTAESTKQQVTFISGKINAMLNLLVKKSNLKLDRVILVGFSIGAQIMGITGQKLANKVDTVVGLDPALYPFSNAEASERLSPSSGSYVQVIHTNSDYYGYKRPLGNADFYLNGGTEQPGCNGDHICSHNRAWEYFAETINSDLIRGGNCSSYENLEHDIDTLNCNTYFQKLGGLKPDHTIVGIFNAETNDTAPYSPHWIY